MEKPNYKFKASVISQGFCQIEKDISKSFYADYVLNRYGEIVKRKYTKETAEKVRSFHLSNNPAEYREAEKINHASYERVKRLRKRLFRFVEGGECCFLTLTFNDDILSKTTEKTRRTYIARFLKSFKVPYVANIDFGKKNHREHYHAVLKVKRIDMKTYDYGYIFAETVHQTTDYIKLSKYVAKLTNHAIKQTTKRNAILYSR